MDTRTAHLDELPPRGGPVAGEAEWRAIRHHFGISAFGVNAWIGRQAGDEVIEDHDERSGGAAGHEELYVVLEGEATFTVDGRDIDGRPGTLIHVPDPGVRRKAVARTAGATVLAIGGAPGSFDVSPWERKYDES